MAEMVQSVARGLHILEIVAEHEEISLTEISMLTKLNKATVHRLLATLISMGYIEQTEKNGSYRQTYKLLLLGNKKVENIDSLQIAKRFISELSNEIKATVHLVIQDKEEVVYVDKYDPTNTGFKVQSRIGKRAPMYCTAVGKVILANKTDNYIQKLWEATEIKKLTENTIVDFHRFMEEIVKARKNNYALDKEENELEVICVATTFCNHTGKVEGAISTSVPKSFFRENEDYFINKIKECGENISKALGYM